MHHCRKLRLYGALAVRLKRWRIPQDLVQAFSELRQVNDGLLQKQIQEHRRHGAISGENLLRCVEPSFIGLVCRSFYR